MAQIISETEMALAEAQAWMSSVLRRVGMTTGERDFVVSLSLSGGWHDGKLEAPIIETTGGRKTGPVATLHFETIPMPGGGTQVRRWLVGDDVEGQFDAVLKAIMERGAAAAPRTQISVGAVSDYDDILVLRATPLEVATWLQAGYKMQISESVAWAFVVRKDDQPNGILWMAIHYKVAENHNFFRHLSGGTEITIIPIQHGVELRAVRTRGDDAERVDGCYKELLRAIGERWPETERVSETGAPRVRVTASSTAIGRGAHHALETGTLPEDEAARHQEFVRLTEKVKETMEFIHLTGPHWGKAWEEWQAKKGQGVEQPATGQNTSALDSDPLATIQGVEAREFVRAWNADTPSSEMADRFGLPNTKAVGTKASRLREVYPTVVKYRRNKGLWGRKD
ncbi:MAG: hypothetical protein IT330_12365 [Anaerolineae bacterium]|nr:hypothetical protein [Anaerolineae bacterium]